VIGSSPQLLVGLAGWWIAKVKGVPFVFEVRDLWPESLTAVGVSSSSSILNRVLGNVAGFLYRNADHIVVVTPAFREHLAKKWRVPTAKISVVPNGVETRLFSPRNPLQTREQLNAQERFVVSFIGTLGFAHGLDTLISAASILQSIAPEVLFLLVGEGADRKRIAEMARQNGLVNIRFTGQQPRENIPCFIAASDVCLVLLKKSEIFKTVIPTKMLEFMSCARPIILAVEGHAREIIERSGAGICIPPENAAALCEAILKLRNNHLQRTILGRNGREYIQQHFCRERTAIDYLNVLSTLTGDANVTEAAVA
jgi:glycosyltransferase involved in cell wall biosynthesis